VSRRTEEELRAELRSLGYPRDSLEGFVTNRLDVREAVPVLLRALPELEDMALKEQVVRGLTTPDTKRVSPEAVSLLVDEFRKSDDHSLRWAIANALAEMADEGDFDEIASLARDGRYGKSREMLALALGRMKKEPRAVDVLLELLDDDVMAGHAIIGLRKLKAKRAKARIEPFRAHDKSWVRTEAKKAVAALEKV
jgi:HEAT repeat protein